MRKLHLLGFVAIIVVLLGSSNLATSTVQSASALSPGCQALNDPFFDDTYGSGIAIGWEFWAGEGILMRAENGQATTIKLCLHSGCAGQNAQLVGTSPFPGAVSYVFPDDVASETVAWEVNTGDADWTVSCFAPGCDSFMYMTPNAAVGRFTADAPTYWAPGQPTAPQVTIPAGKTAWVLGMDASGAYYQIIWACDLLWVPVETMGPNYDEVWNGTPLPTGVVE